MSEKLPIISGKEFIRFLINIGFVESRVNGSHHRLKHKDGCVTTVPIHKNDDIPKGLLRKIIREDLEFDMDKFLTEWRNYKK